MKTTNARRASCANAELSGGGPLSNELTEAESRRPLERIVIQRLLRKWRRKAEEFGNQVRPEWEHGDRYASRRYEGESIAFRWCAEDLEAALYNTKLTDRPDSAAGAERKHGN